MVEVPLKRHLVVSTTISGHDPVSRIVSILGGRLAVTYLNQPFVDIYKIDGNRKRTCRFSRHSRTAVAVVHICDDLVASLDSRGSVLIWNASTCDVLASCDLEVDKLNCLYMMKLNSTTLVIGLDQGRLRIVSHNSGLNLKHRYDICTKSATNRYGLCSVNENKFAVSGAKGIEIYYYCNGALIKTINSSDSAYLLEANARFIVASCKNGVIHLHENGGDYALKSRLDLDRFLQSGPIPTYGIQSLYFVSSNLLMVSTGDQGTFFVTLPEMKVVTVIEPQEIRREIQTTANSVVLGANQVCVGGTNFCSVFALSPESYEPVQEIQENVQLSFADQGSSEMQPSSPAENNASPSSKSESISKGLPSLLVPAAEDKSCSETCSITAPVLTVTRTPVSSEENPERDEMLDVTSGKSKSRLQIEPSKRNHVSSSSRIDSISKEPSPARVGSSPAVDECSSSLYTMLTGKRGRASSVEKSGDDAPDATREISKKKLRSNTQGQRSQMRASESAQDTGSLSSKKGSPEKPSSLPFENDTHSETSTITIPCIPEKPMPAGSVAKSKDGEELDVPSDKWKKSCPTDGRAHLPEIEELNKKLTQLNSSIEAVQLQLASVQDEAKKIELELENRMSGTSSRKGGSKKKDSKPKSLRRKAKTKTQRNTRTI